MEANFFSLCVLRSEHTCARNDDRKETPYFKVHLSRSNGNADVHKNDIDFYGFLPGLARFLLKDTGPLDAERVCVIIMDILHVKMLTFFVTEIQRIVTATAVWLVNKTKR